MSIDIVQVLREVSGCLDSQRRLSEWLSGLGGVDSEHATRLPGWTVGHVLTHIARNADSHRVMLEGQPQYPSIDARNEGIERGSRRPWDALVDDVTQSSQQLAVVWNEMVDADHWEGSATLASGSAMPRTVLPILRWREVEIHRVDLGLGYELADLDHHYVRCDLRLLEMLWRARRPIGLSPLTDAIRETPPPLRLAWFLGRHEIDGVAPSGLL